MTPSQLVDLAKEHSVEIIGSMVASNLISQSMPPAGPDSSTIYKWMYAFLHLISLNIRNLVSMWFPQVMNIPGFQKAVEQQKEKDADNSSH